MNGVNWIGIFVAVFLSTACGPPPPTAQAAEPVEYVVSGPGVASLTYSVAGGSTQQLASAPLPWSHRFYPERGAFLYVSAQRTIDDAGCVVVQIRRGQAVVKSAESCGAFVIATANGMY